MESSKKIDIIEKTYISSLIGLRQVVFTFGLGHPFDLIKTKLQANPEIKNGLVLSKLIYKKNGILGFYSGGQPNFTRACIKEAYRNPMRGFLKKLYTDTIPSELNRKYPELRNLATGLTMAGFDTFILCPLERMKVWLMTRADNQSFYSFCFKKNSSESLHKILFRGLNVSFIRSGVSWSSYLILEEKIRLYLIKNEIDKNNISFKKQIIIGSLSGAINSLLTLPFDAVKTHIQKSSASESNFFRIFLKIINEHGIWGLYAGWKYRIPSYIIIALITSQNIQRIDRIWQIDEPKMK